MPDCFISYSSSDQGVADFVHDELTRHGVTVFMASASLQPGEEWSCQVKEELQASSWVVFLASSAACQSAYVQQELGMAMGANKRLVPIVWEIPPSQLPGWVNRSHALNLKDKTTEEIQWQLSEIAQRIKQDKNVGILVTGALLLWILGSRQ